LAGFISPAGLHQKLRYFHDFDIRPAGGMRRLIGHPITCATSNSEPAAAFTLPTDARGVRSSGARVQKKLDGKPGFVPMTLR
jgi:hypothetical protein